MQVQRVLETCLYAENLDEVATFYTEVLGLVPFTRLNQRHVFFRSGDSVLLLFNPVQTARATGDVPGHGAFGQGHVAFAISPQAIAGWRDQLRSHGVAIEAEIAWPRGGQSLYFRDPAGNSVELTTPKTWDLDEHLPSSGASYRRALDLLPVGVCFVDPESSEILLANSSAASVLDAVAAQALIGQSLLSYAQPQRRAEIRGFLRRVAEEAPQLEFFRERLELATGRHVDLEIAAGMLDIAGRAVIQVAFRDVSDRVAAEAALRESEALFRQLAETTDAAIFLFRGSQNIHVNAAACKITGYSHHELVAMPFWQIVHPDYRDLVRERGLARQQGEPIASNYEVAILTKSGETRWLQYAGNLIDYQGQPAVLGTAIDITARKEVEQEQRRNARRLETLSQIDHLGLMAMSRQEVASSVLDHIRTLIPCDRASIVDVDAPHKSHVVLAVSPAGYTKIQVGRRFKLAHWQAVHDSLAHGLHYVPDLDAMPSLSPPQREIRAEGIRSYIAVPLAAQGKLVGVLNLGSQETHAFDADLQTAALEVGRRLALVMYNAYLFDELESSHHRLEELSRRLVMLQEAERRAIARELHDQVGQTLTALSIHLDLASRAGADEQLQRLSATQRLVEDLADQLRRISLDLRPPMLDDLGLLPTLLWYFEWVAEQYHLDVTFEQHGIERRFDGDIETAVFRIVQEALTNVARHAQTSAATVRLWADSATISAQIEDKGLGFDLVQALHSDSGGLSGMQERARLLGGKLVIDARPGNGACLTALIPLQRTLPATQGDA